MKSDLELLRDVGAGLADEPSVDAADMGVEAHAPTGHTGGVLASVPSGTCAGFC